MTHDRRKQARAVLLSAIMIVSMFGGSLALAGSAAAAEEATVSDVDTGAQYPSPGDSGVMVQELTVTDDGNDGDPTEIDSATISNDGTAENSDVNTITVYEEAAGEGFDSGDDNQLVTGSDFGTELNGEGNDNAITTVTDGESTTLYVVVELASDAADTDTIQTTTSLTTTSGTTSTFSDGGDATATSITEVDAAPEITGATTADNDGNGQIDEVAVDFSEAVSVADGDASDGIDGLSIGSYSVDGIVSGDGSSTITFSVTESGSADTGATPSVSYSNGQGGLEDADQDSKEVAEYSATAATDGAAPAATSLNAGESSGDLTVTLEASESLDSLGATVTAPDDSQAASLSLSDFSEDGTTYELDTAVPLGQAGTYEVALGSLSDGTNSNTSLTDTATVDAGGVSDVSITADPAGPGQDSTHNATWTLSTGTDVQTYEVAYPTDETDVSNVGNEDIVKFGVDRNGDGELEEDFTNTSSNAGGVNEVNIGDGHVLTVTTSSSTTIEEDETLILEYSDVQNSQDDDEVDLRLDPQTPDVDATRTLTIEGTSPSVSSVSLNGQEISGEPTFGQNVNGTSPSTIEVVFDETMNTSVSPSVNLTIDGAQYSVNTSAESESWSQTNGNSDDTYSADLEEVVAYDGVTVDGTFTVLDAEDTDGNSIDEASESFSIDTEPLGIDSAKTVDDPDDDQVETIEVTFNDSTDSGTVDIGDFLVDGSQPDGIGDNNGDNIVTLDVSSSFEYASNATPNVTITEGVMDDDNGNANVRQELNATDAVSPDITDFTLTQKDGRQLNTTIDSNEQLANITVEVSDSGDNVVTTLNKSDLDESANADGTYTYATNFTVDTDGTFKAELTEATDDANNAGDVEVSNPTSTVDVDVTGPSITPEADTTNNSIVVGQQDITADIADEGNSVNPESIYVTVEDSTGTLVDRGRVSAVSGLSYAGTTLTIESEDGDTFEYAEGDVDVTVEATDTNGEQNTESWSFTYSTVTVEEFESDEGSLSVNVSTATDFENVNATVESSETLANEDGKISQTVDLTAEGDYYTGTLEAERDGQYNLNDVTLENAAGNTASATPGDAADVNTTAPHPTDAYISSYDGSDTQVTVQFNEPLSDSSFGTGTLNVDGSAPDTTVGGQTNFAEGKLTVQLTGTALQTGDEPNVSVNTASDVQELYSNDGAADLSAGANTTIHTVQLSLSEDTNFVSVPAAAGTVDLSEHDDNVDVVWTYDDGSWESYEPDKSDENNDFTELEGGQGYVFEMDNGDTLDVNAYNVVGGDTRESATPGQQDLEEGWNLVGHWQEGTQSQSNAIDKLNNQDGRIYQQATDGEYTLNNDQTEFTPGEAYWVFVNDDDTYAESNVWA